MVTQPELFNPCGGHLSLDFVNSAGRTAVGLQNERLVDYAALLRWCRESGSLPPAAAERLERAAEARPGDAIQVLTRARVMREALFETWHAFLHQLPGPVDALSTINKELALCLAHARLEPLPQGFGWGWEAAPEALDAPLWPIARAAAELLVSPEREQVAECAADTCMWLFLDRTRNHGRRWCEMKSCGNRAKVRQHRRRRRS